MHLCYHVPEGAVAGLWLTLVIKQHVMVHADLCSVHQ